MGVDTVKLVEAIVGHGVLGVLLVLAVFALWRKDQELAQARKEAAEAIGAMRDKKDAELAQLRAELAEVHERRVDDAKALGDRAINIQERTTTAVSQLANVVEAVGRRP